MFTSMSIAPVLCPISLQAFKFALYNDATRISKDAHLNELGRQGKYTQQRCTGQDSAVVVRASEHALRIHNCNIPNARFGNKTGFVDPDALQSALVLLKFMGRALLFGPSRVKDKANAIRC